jgi:hypothetical protein
MKLDRNINSDGSGKYALLKLRALANASGADLKAFGDALDILKRLGVLDWGNVGTESEFMVMRLKDKYAYKGLMGYYNAIMQEDQPDFEYAEDVLDMAKRAGPHSQWCKKPD